MLALIAVVYEVTTEELSYLTWAGSNAGWIVLAALSFSLLGDIFLMLESDKFVHGLSAFLLAHLCYVAVFVESFAEPETYAVGALIAIVSTVLFVRIKRGIVERRRTKLIIPVALYVIAISVMVAAAVGALFLPRVIAFEGFRGVELDPLAWRPARFAAIGAVLFYISDAMIGWTRFVRDFKHSRLAIMVTYHLGQMGFVLFLLRS